MKHTKVLVGMLLAVLVAIVFVGCVPENMPPRVVSDSDEHFNDQSGIGIIVDDNMYIVTGTVEADVNSLTNINEKGQVNGVMAGGYGSIGGSWSVWQEGKGFVRLRIESIEPDPAHDVGDVGNLIIVKTTDTKLRAVLPGDRISLKCRIQYEAVAPVRDNTTWTEDVRTESETYELDYCRMISPVISEE